MRRPLAVLSVAFGLALVTGIVLAAIWVWLILDPDRRDLGSLAGVSGGLLGALAMLLQTGPRLWFDLRSDQRATHADSMATLRERNEVNAKISALSEGGPYPHGTPQSIELQGLEEDRIYLTAVITERRLVQVASREIALLTPNREATLAVEEVQQLRELLERSAASTDVLDADGWFLRGNALYTTGNYVEAVDAYERALHLDPGSDDARHNLSAALVGAGRYEEAIEAFDRSLRLQPDDPDALHNLGAALVAVGRHEEALEAYDRALHLRPNGVDTLFNLGVALGELGHFEGALDAFDRSLRLRPDDPDALMGRGAALISLGRYEEALDACDRALALRPDDLGTLNNRGLALAALGRDE